MGWKGMAIGGYIGSLFGGPLGAILGAVLGHKVEGAAFGRKFRRNVAYSSMPQRDRAKLFCASAAAMLAKMAKVAEDLEAALEAQGVDVIVDDRAERPGVKFKDADLIGFPVRVVVGAKGLANGGVEVKRRCDDKSKMKIVPVAEAVAAIREALA